MSKQDLLLSLTWVFSFLFLCACVCVWGRWVSCHLSHHSSKVSLWSIVEMAGTGGEASCFLAMACCAEILCWLRLISTTLGTFKVVLNYSHCRKGGGGWHIKWSSYKHIYQSMLFHKLKSSVIHFCSVQSVNKHSLIRRGKGACKKSWGVQAPRSRQAQLVLLKT